MSWGPQMPAHPSAMETRGLAGTEQNAFPSLSVRGQEGCAETVLGCVLTVHTAPTQKPSCHLSCHPVW